jgi:23S rRNA (cytidine1920-2'-O)/16S rRNA (cytidine1409-2'-O)-methyltransferase
MRKSRLDLLLVDKGIAESRSQAQRMIMAGMVSINGEMVVKPSSQYHDEVEVTISKKPAYVSRGGEKLEAALEAFGLLDLEGITCADIGSSTGGFTDCLLKHHARRVYAVDVGYGQLHWNLRKDPRVVVMERTNARNVEGFPEAIQLVTIDASFISLKTLINCVPKWFVEGRGQVVALIKPQFEAGRKDAARGQGVIRDPDIHRRVVEDVLQSAVRMGYGLNGLIRSPLLGPKGNVEYLVHLQYPPYSSMDPEILIHVLFPDPGSGDGLE